jgi:hypothetical protein
MTSQKTIIIFQEQEISIKFNCYLRASQINWQMQISQTQQYQQIN